MKTPIVALDMAQNEFDRWAEGWHIDTDVESMEAEDKTSFEVQKRKIMQAMMKGKLAVNDDLSLTITLIEPVMEKPALTMSIPRGTAYNAMDKHKERESVHKIASFMANACGVPPQIFSNMDGRDYKIFHAVTLLFLG